MTSSWSGQTSTTSYGGRSRGVSGINVIFREAVVLSRVSAKTQTIKVPTQFCPLTTALTDPIRPSALSRSGSRTLTRAIIGVSHSGPKFNCGNTYPEGVLLLYDYQTNPESSVGDFTPTSPLGNNGTSVHSMAVRYQILWRSICLSACGRILSLEARRSTTFSPF